MDGLERVQSYYTRLIPGIRNLSYTDRLARLKLSSLEWRLDRYRILYVRKALKGLVPLMGLEASNDETHHLGFKLKILFSK